MAMVHWPHRKYDILLTFKNYLLVVINLHMVRIAELLLGVQPRFRSGPHSFLSLHLTSSYASRAPP